MPMTETQIYSIEDQLSTLINLIQSSNVPAFPANQYPNNGAGLPNSVSSQETNMAVDQEGPMSTDAGMPDDVVAAAVDTYFDYCHNQPYSFFHEAHFRRRLSEKTVPTHLLLSIIATAARFCSHPYFAGRVHEASVECANRAWKLIVADCFTGGTGTEISAVQTVALLGLFDFTGRPYSIQTETMFCCFKQRGNAKG